MILRPIMSSAGAVMLIAMGGSVATPAEKPDLSQAPVAEPLPIKQTMRSLDERVAALSSSVPGELGPIEREAIRDQVHAVGQLLERADELTAGRPAASTDVEDKRKAILTELALDLEKIGAAAESGDSAALRRVYRQVDIRDSCQACHQLYNVPVDVSKGRAKK